MADHLCRKHVEQFLFKEFFCLSNPDPRIRAPITVPHDVTASPLALHLVLTVNGNAGAAGAAMLRVAS